MCIIAICKDSFLPKEEFIECFEKNDDGFGMAWRNKEEVEFQKGIMDKISAYNYYKEFQEKEISHFPHILHFRLGSPVIPELTHPFIISKNSELDLEGITEKVLFHNGIVSDWKTKCLNMFVSLGYIPEGEWSDTRMVAILIDKLGNNILEHVNGKFVVFDKDSIVTCGDFEKDNELPGILFSNNSYKVRRNKGFFQDYNHKQTNNLFLINSTMEDMDEFII